MNISSLESGEQEVSDSDAQLVIAVCRANQLLSDTFIAVIGNGCGCTLAQLCGVDDLDDFVQEVFLRAWRGLPKFRQSSQCSTWLYRITWNVAIDYRHAKGKARSRQSRLSPSDAPTGTARLQQLHYEDVVERGLRSLSLNHRAVLVLHEQSGSALYA